MTQKTSKSKEPAASKAAGAKATDVKGDQAGTDIKKESSSKTSTGDKVTITFKKPWGKYANGDVATFDADRAAKLLKMKVAIEGDKKPESDTKTDEVPA